MPPAAPSVLSPLATPFVPTREGYQEFASFSGLYNDGVTAGVFYGNHVDHTVIHNIPDDSIEEIFPPSAADAAELDAVDDFLRAMVDLSFLEEDEEKTRENYGHYLKKRWEARRQNGLLGKPHTFSRSGMQNMNHAFANMLKPNERKLVHFDRHRRAHCNIENKRRLLAAAKNHDRHLYGKKGCGSSYGYSKPIQQPRKMN